MDKNDLSQHHAYLLRGENEALETAREVARELLGTSLEDNRDYIELFTPDWKIEDSRTLVELTDIKAIKGKRVIVCMFEAIRHEAQNVLLKVFEEPPVGTYLIVVIPRELPLLPTLRSRLIDITSQGDQSSNLLSPRECREFIKARVPQRLAHVKKMIEEKDRRGLLKLIESLEGEVMREVRKKGEVQKHTVILEELEELRKYALTPQASVKLIAEHLSLTFPHMIG